ncbi:MAG: hypothetical protein EZS28_022918, partial [Streblomastix strix]
MLIELSNAVDAENTKDYKKALQHYKDAQKSVELAIKFQKYPQEKESYQQKLDSVVRTMASTDKNIVSSRSHAILQITIEGRPNENKE